MAVKLTPTIGQGVWIKYKGIFDFSELWRLIGDWFESKGFEVQESKAKHKAGTFGEDFEVGMDAWRNVTDYYRFEIKVFCKYWDGNFVEVVKGNEKKRMVKARLDVRLNGTLVLDYTDRFDKTRFGQHLGAFMNKYVVKWQFESIYGDQLNYKILELQNLIKEYLNMEARGSEFADAW